MARKEKLSTQVCELCSLFILNISDHFPFQNFGIGVHFSRRKRNGWEHSFKWKKEGEISGAPQLRKTIGDCCKVRGWSAMRRRMTYYCKPIPGVMMNQRVVDVVAANNYHKEIPSENESKDDVFLRPNTTHI